MMAHSRKDHSSTQSLKRAREQIEKDDKLGLAIKEHSSPSLMKNYAMYANVINDVTQMLNEAIGTAPAIRLLKRNDYLKSSAFPDTLKKLKEIDGELNGLDKNKIRVAQEILDGVEARDSLDADYLRGLSTSSKDGLIELEKKYMDRLEIIRLLIIHKDVEDVSRAVEFLETWQSSFDETEEVAGMSPTYDSVFNRTRSIGSRGLFPSGVATEGRATSSAIHRPPSTRRRTEAAPNAAKKPKTSLSEEEKNAKKIALKAERAKKKTGS